MSRPFLGSLERAERAATVDTLDKLASALGVDPGALLERPGGRPAAAPAAEVLGRKVAFLAASASPGALSSFERIAGLFFECLADHA